MRGLAPTIALALAAAGGCSAPPPTPPPEAASRAAPATPAPPGGGEAARGAPAPAPAPPVQADPGTWTDWGPWSGGMRMRARVRREFPRGEPLSVECAVEFDPEGAEPGTTHFDADGSEVKVFLVCEDRGTGRRVEAKPYDCGMPGPPLPPGVDAVAGRYVPLTAPPPPLGAQFFLSVSWDDLRPGTYEAHLEFRDPRDRPRRGSDEVDWQPPRVWTGTLRTAPFPLVVEDAPAEPLHLRVPRRLVVRPPGASGDFLAEIGYGPEDAEDVEVRVRHGFEVGTQFWWDGEPSMVMTGVPRPDDPDRAMGIDRDHAGPLETTLRIVVFECAGHASHGFTPGPRSPGGRVLWEGTFTVKASAEELDALRR